MKNPIVSLLGTAEDTEMYLNILICLAKDLDPSNNEKNRTDVKEYYMKLL